MSQPAFDFGDDELDDAANPTYTVGELAEAINDALRRGFSDGVWVRGEISGWSDRGQHAYFTLVDDDGTKAAVNVQFFANARMRLRPMLQKHRLRLADGMKVRVFGYLDYARKRGGFGPEMIPTGNIAEDMEVIRDFYSPIRGKYPECFGEIRLKEEM